MRKVIGFLAVVVSLLIGAAPVFADSVHIGGTDNITVQGGAGGNAAAAASSSSSSSSAATAVNTTTIHNSNIQSQGQQQGQSQYQGQIQGQGQNNDQNISPSQSVKIDGTSFDRYAPTVVAPGLTAAGTGVCLGSVAVGLSGPMAGLSFGITKVDKGCEQRSAAALLWQFGYHDAAVRLLMNNDDVKAAMGADAAKLSTASTLPAVLPVTLAAPAPAPVVVAAPKAEEKSACGAGMVLRPSGFCAWAK